MKSKSTNKNPALAYLGRRLLQNQKAFTVNNVMRNQAISRYGTPKFRKVFQMIPALIQLNQPKIPGFLDSPNVPRGIHGFDRSGFVNITHQLFDKDMVSRRQLMASNPVVESLFLMGSSGSIGHTSNSDLDFWVCIDVKKIKANQLKLFTKKLDLITEWADKQQGIEVTFFPIDLADLLDNRLGALAGEEAGDVMPLILKEELYRTLLHVVGRVPLWWAVPPDTYADDYKEIAKSLKKIPNPSFYPEDYIDLGFPHRPPPEEYFGGALWQLDKAKSDPFKAVIKMVLLYEQAESGLRAPFLCDQLKGKLLSSPEEELPIDPYALMIKRILDFSVLHFTREQQELVQTSVYFKIYSPLGSTVMGKDSPKARFLMDLIEDWEWGKRKIREMETYGEWPESKKQTLGMDINRLLKELQTGLTARLKVDFPEQVGEMDQAASGLGDLSRAYKENISKVETLPSAQYRKSLPKTLTLAHEDDQWKLYAGVVGSAMFSTNAKKGRQISSFTSPVLAAAWLVHNNLYVPEMDLRMRLGHALPERENLSSLLDQMKKNFPPVKAKQLDRRKEKTPKPEGFKFLVLNIAQPGHEDKIRTAELLTRNTWGEMFYQAIQIDLYMTEADKYVLLSRNIFPDEDKTLADLKIHAVNTVAGQELKENTRSALSVYLSSDHSPKQEKKRPRSKLQLDLD